MITGSDAAEIYKFKGDMHNLFKMADLGLLSFYLGVEVKQGAHGIIITQSAYAQKLLEKSGMAGCKMCHVPMEPRFKLSRESTMLAVDATEYRSIIGSLRYLVHTHPDLTFSVRYVS